VHPRGDQTLEDIGSRAQYFMRSAPSLVTWSASG